MWKFIKIGVPAAFIAGGLALPLAVRPGQDEPTPPPGAAKSPTTRSQQLMREKLTYAKEALDGLSLADYDQIARSARVLLLMNRACARAVVGNPEYDQCSRNFQEQAADLERHARERNLDAAALDYTRIALTCVQCHKYVRQAHAEKSLWPAEAGRDR